MANTLTNFLVGIGLDFDKKGARDASSSIDSVKRHALQAGSAIAGAFGAKALTIDVASRAASLSRLAEVYGGTAQQISAMGMALEREGGSLDSFIGQMSSLEKIRARMAMHDFSFVPEGALAGADVSAIIGAENAMEAMLRFAEQFPRLTREQRLNVAGVFGFDDAMIRLLSTGRGEIEKSITKLSEMREINKELEESSKKFQREWSNMWDNAAGAVDKAGGRMIPQINEIMSAVNQFFDENRGGVNSGAEVLGEAIVSPIDGFVKGLGVASYYVKAYANEAAGALNEDYKQSLPHAAGVALGGMIFDINEYFSKTAPGDIGQGISNRNLGTTVTPADVSAGMATTQSQPQTKTVMKQPVNIFIGNKKIEQIIFDIINDQDEQALEDVTSPLIN